MDILLWCSIIAEFLCSIAKGKRSSDSGMIGMAGGSLQIVGGPTERIDESAKQGAERADVVEPL